MYTSFMSGVSSRTGGGAHAAFRQGLQHALFVLGEGLVLTQDGRRLGASRQGRADRQGP